MINIDISYAEMSFLRELVKKEQGTIWRDKWLPNLKVQSDELIESVWKKTMEENPDVLTEEGCCFLLLKRFQEIENEIQEKLKGG